ncbi:MAG: hypothetical protein CMJ83_18375, partial [Planctomycetes bacterium]|nr:hypothetical protein [Planctomycetota bacterium]
PERTWRSALPSERIASHVLQVRAPGEGVRVAADDVSSQLPRPVTTRRYRELPPAAAPPICGSGVLLLPTPVAWIGGSLRNHRHEPLTSLATFRVVAADGDLTTWRAQCDAAGKPDSTVQENRFRVPVFENRAHHLEIRIQERRFLVENVGPSCEDLVIELPIETPTARPKPQRAGRTLLTTDLATPRLATVLDNRWKNLSGIRVSTVVFSGKTVQSNLVPPQPPAPQPNVRNPVCLPAKAWDGRNDREFWCWELAPQ